MSDTHSHQISQIAINYDINEFIDGQRDCRDGVPHKDGTESYNAGYAAQYQLEQIQGARYVR